MTPQEHHGQVDDTPNGVLASCSCGWGEGAATMAEGAIELARHYREHPPAVPRDGHRRGPGSPSALVLRRLTRQALDRQHLRRWGS